MLFNETGKRNYKQKESPAQEKINVFHVVQRSSVYLFFPMRKELRFHVTLSVSGRDLILSSGE